MSSLFGLHLARKKRKMLGWVLVNSKCKDEKEESGKKKDRSGLLEVEEKEVGA